jgi:predicted porin
VRIVNSTGIFGASPILFANSSTLNDNASPTVWSRRQNNSIMYDTPVWNGLQAYAMVSTPSTAVGATNNMSGAKPRLYSVAANYSNGPLLLTATYEVHRNFMVGAPVNGNYAGTDTGYLLGAAYMFGPVKVGVLYTKQKMDGGAGTDANVSAWGVAGEWTVSGLHGVRAGYDRANNTTGSFVAGPGSTLLPASNRVFNGGLGNTGGSLWQILYVFKASKRTELTAGYVEVRNDANARYSLSGLPAPAAGQNQSAVAATIKHQF